MDGNWIIRLLVRLADKYEIDEHELLGSAFDIIMKFEEENTNHADQHTGA